MYRKLIIIFSYILLSIIILSSCSIISKSDSHQEELNTRTAIELVKEKTNEGLTNTYNFCVQISWNPSTGLTEQQAGCSYNTTFSTEKVNENEYIVTMTFTDIGPALRYMWENGGVFNSYISPLKFRVLLDNNVVLPEDSISESFLK